MNPINVNKFPNLASTSPCEVPDTLGAVSGAGWSVATPSTHTLTHEQEATATPTHGIPQSGNTSGPVGKLQVTPTARGSRITRVEIPRTARADPQTKTRAPSKLRTKPHQHQQQHQTRDNHQQQHKHHGAPKRHNLRRRTTRSHSLSVTMRFAHSWARAKSPIPRSFSFPYQFESSTLTTTATSRVEWLGTEGERLQSPPTRPQPKPNASTVVANLGPLAPLLLPRFTGLPNTTHVHRHTQPPSSEPPGPCGRRGREKGSQGRSLWRILNPLRSG